MSDKNGKSMTTYEFPSPPEKKSFFKWIYDSSENSYFGRTPKSWGQLGLFYLIFYIILAALFSICMQGLLYSLSDAKPTYLLEESRIGSSPGLNYRPMPEEPSDVFTITYNASNKNDVKDWVELLGKFEEPYRSAIKVGGLRNQVVCDFNSPPKPDQVCIVEPKLWGPCTQENGYGFNKSAPCVLLKINRIFSWVPEPYNDPEDLPAEMPQDLKDYIKALEPAKRNQVWLSCRGNKEADVAAVGPMKYFPSMGVPAYYYPFTNQPGYLSPIVAVQFERPQPDQLIEIECRAWAKNIKYVQSIRERQGSVVLSVMVKS